MAFATRTVIFIEMLAFGIGTFLYVAVVAREYNRVLIFKEPVEGKILQGHVIRTEKVANEGSCRVKCFLEPNCVSINVGPADDQGHRTCELNNLTDEGPLQTGLTRTEKPGHIHYSAENICRNNSCPRGNFICQVGFTAKRYRCVCRDGFKGENCDEEINECKLDTECRDASSSEPAVMSKAVSTASLASTNQPSQQVSLSEVTTVLNPLEASSTALATASLQPISPASATTSSTTTSIQPTSSASFKAQWKGFGSSSYVLYISPKDWNTAKENCREVGGELVKIESEEENQFIKTEYLSARGRYWIGLSDLDYNGQWEWTDGTGLTGYAKWSSGQPKNNNDQQCITILKGQYFGWFDGEWDDYFCSEELGYICEK